jgi:hypothetical protein
MPKPLPPSGIDTPGRGLYHPDGPAASVNLVIARPTENNDPPLSRD